MARRQRLVPREKGCLNNLFDSELVGSFEIGSALLTKHIFQVYHQHYITLDLLDFDQNLDQSAVGNCRKSKHARAYSGGHLELFSEFEPKKLVSTPH